MVTGYCEYKNLLIVGNVVRMNLSSKFLIIGEQRRAF